MRLSFFSISLYAELMPASFLPQFAARSGLSAPSDVSCAARLHPSSFSCPPDLPEHRLKIAAERAHAAFCEPSLLLFSAVPDCSLRIRLRSPNQTRLHCCASALVQMSILHLPAVLSMARPELMAESAIQTLSRSGCWPTAAACLISLRLQPLLTLHVCVLYLLLSTRSPYTQSD